MSAELCLPSLFIEGFRGIQSLEFPQLGRITLLAGVNGVGKTSVLEAVRFYSARGDTRVLRNVLVSREEFVSILDEDGEDVLIPDFSSLFYSADGSNEATPIRVRCGSGEHNLTVRLADPDDQGEISDLFPQEEDPKVLKVFVGECNRTIYAGRLEHYYDRLGKLLPIRATRQRNPIVSDSGPWPSPILHESLGPGLLTNQDLSRLWDAVALTEGEDLAIEALRLVVGNDIEKVAIIADSPRRYGPRARDPRAVAKLRSSTSRVPLKRLGDGANRLFAIALALVNARDGVLLIDEAENGLHYSIQADYWRMIFRAAEMANVQVIAATHSWDCIVGFAAAAVEAQADGMMFRLERSGNELHAIGYSKENLEIAARQRTEVR